MKENKPWITSILVDLFSTLIILLGVTLDILWLIYIIAAYTALLLISRLLLLSSSQLRAITMKKPSAAPKWIYHLLYALNSGLLTLFGWFILAAAWVVIWILSVFSSRNSK